MSVESAVYISQLDAAKPGSTDLKSEGDNHLRLLKTVLKTNFPNLTATPVTPTSADFNTLANAATTGASGLKVVTASTTDNSTAAASTALVDAKIALTMTDLTGAAIVNSKVYAFENEINYTDDYTVTTGKNSMAAGPIVVSPGKTVTIPSGSTYTIV